jgi:tripartite-type tricarboxylate transporter receptor subunit TctC
MTNRRTFLRAGTAAAAASAVALPSLAQQAPAAPAVDQLKIVLGFPAGGTSDATARRVGEKIRGDYVRDAVIVENKTGAGGRIAIDTVKAAAPDGKTFLLAPHSTLSIYPYIYKQLSYNSFEDFIPVSMGSVFSIGFAVGPMVPDSVKTLKDFAAWCKANPTKANYGSPAPGSTPHFTGWMIGNQLGVEMKHVPYRGSVPGVQDVAGGQIAAMCTPVGDFLQMAKAGRLRILATSASKRSRFTPEVPTFAESGVDTVQHEEWFAFFAPKGTPANLIQAASTSIAKALASQDVRDGLGTFGLEAQGSSSATLGRALKFEYDNWGPIVKRIGFTAES